MEHKILDEHLSQQDENQNDIPKTAVETEASAIFKFIVLFQAIIGLVFTILVWQNVDNFMGFLINLLVGLYVVVLGVSSKNKLALLVGAGTLVFCISTITILLFLDSNYRIAQKPIVIALGIYTILVTWATFHLFFPPKRILIEN